MADGDREQMDRWKRAIYTFVEELLEDRSAIVQNLTTSINPDFKAAKKDGVSQTDIMIDRSAYITRSLLNIISRKNALGYMGASTLFLDWEKMSPG